MKNDNTLECKTDEELAIEAQSNEMAYNILAQRFDPLIKNLTSYYFINGNEKSDLMQEALIGLYNAIKGYDSKQDVSFKVFATLCIKRKLITAIKTSTRKKNIILNNSISLETPSTLDEDCEREMKDLIIDDKQKDPCVVLVEKEYQDGIRNAINSKLSQMEREVLNEYIEGKTYIDIANSLNIKTKSVDTALTRIRKKANEIRKYYD